MIKRAPRADDRGPNDDAQVYGAGGRGSSAGDTGPNLCCSQGRNVEHPGIFHRSSVVASREYHREQKVTAL